MHPRAFRFLDLWILLLKEVTRLRIWDAKIHYCVHEAAKCCAPYGDKCLYMYEPQTLRITPFTLSENVCSTCGISIRSLKASSAGVTRNSFHKAAYYFNVLIHECIRHYDHNSLKRVCKGSLYPREDVKTVPWIPHTQKFLFCATIFHLLGS